MGQCVKALLAPESLPLDQLEAAHRLADLFIEATGFSYDPARPSPEGRESILASGKALSPYEAALCIREHRRTGTFLRGVHDGLQALLEQVEQRPIRVVYGGCGPFAALMTPLLPLFPAADIRVVLLDIHSRSLDLAMELLTTLGLEDRIESCHQGDAAAFEADGIGPVHMVLTETMQAALAREPQVAVSAHLAPLLEPEGILIPQRVRLDAVLLNPAVEFSVERMQGGHSERRPLGTVFQIDLDAARRIHAEHGPRFDEGVRVPAGSVCLPALRDKEEVWILTEIQAYGDAKLSLYESGLTIPQAAAVSGPLYEGRQIHFSYEMGRSPGLVCEPGTEPRG